VTSTEITIEPISPKPFEKNKNIVVLNVPQRERFPPPSSRDWPNADQPRYHLNTAVVGITGCPLR
jgi:hypothetical protein